jgi:hypothetical protein
MGSAHGSAIAPNATDQARDGELLPPHVRAFLGFWNWALPAAQMALAGLLVSKLRSSALEWLKAASRGAQLSAGLACGGAFVAVAAFVFVAYNEALCATQTQFVGRGLLCHEWARSAVTHLSLDLSAYGAQTLGVAAVAVFNVPRRTVNAVIAQLAVLGGVVAVCSQELALGAWWVCIYVGAPCAVAWAVQVGWRWLRPEEAAGVKKKPSMRCGPIDGCGYARLEGFCLWRLLWLRWITQYSTRLARFLDLFLHVVSTNVRIIFVGTRAPTTPDGEWW